MSFWSGLGKVLGAVGSVASFIPGMGAAGLLGKGAASLFGAGEGGSIASNGLASAGGAVGALGNLFSQFGSESDQAKLYQQQMAYMHPKEQMKRLQEAGLNPNLIYGSNGVTGVSDPSHATAPNLSQYLENKYQKISPAEAVAISNAQQQQHNENRLVGSQIAMNNAKANRERVEAKKAEGEITSIANYNSLFDLHKQLTKYRTAIMREESDVASMTASKMQQTYNYQCQQIYEDLQNTIKQGKVLDAQQRKIVAETLIIPLEGLAYAANAGKANEEALSYALQNRWLQDISPSGKPNYYIVNETKLDKAIADADAQTLENIFGDKGQLGSLLGTAGRAALTGIRVYRYLTTGKDVNALRSQRERNRE